MKQTFQAVIIYITDRDIIISTDVEKITVHAVLLSNVQLYRQTDAAIYTCTDIDATMYRYKDYNMQCIHDVQAFYTR